MLSGKWGLWGILAAFMLATACGAITMAARYQDSNYTIDSVIGNNFGGQATSTNYLMVSSAGETVIGNGKGGSFMLGNGYVAQLEQSFQLNVQPSGLIAHYPLDENQGVQIYDATPSGLDMSVINGEADGAKGKLNGSHAFNGTNEYVTMEADYQELDVDPGDAKTFSAWFKTGDQSGSQYEVILYKEGACVGYTLSVDPIGAVVLAMVTGDGYCNTNVRTMVGAWSPRYDDNQWHHAVGVIDRINGRLQLYVDGQLRDQTTSLPTTGAADSGVFRLGTQWNATEQFFTGSIDNVKVFDRALTEQEVKSEYNAQSAGKSSGLSLNTITPGGSSTAGLDAIVQTDAPGYTLAINQDHDLETTGATIPAISSAIASPAAWSEGTTKGLGFTVSSGPGLDGKWASGTNFASFPNVATTFHTRQGYMTAGSKDVIRMKARADVATSQRTGEYSNTITVTGTMLP